MKRLRSSLTLKIFILTLFLLLAISGITYASVAVFLPKTYRNSLEKDLASVSESLKTELESYASIEEAENFLEFFERNNQASVTVLDKEGNQVFPEVETEVADTVSTGSEESMVVEEDGLVTSAELPSATRLRRSWGMTLTELRFQMRGILLSAPAILLL